MSSERKIGPTILTGVTQEMAVMSEEVFGPVLAVLPYDDLDEVIDYVNARPSPLGAYWMGKDSDDFRRFCARTRSGGVTRNDIMVHGGVNGAPFGGVGNSGMGAYHGKAGFDTFTHYRTVTESRLRCPRGIDGTACSGTTAQARQLGGGQSGGQVAQADRPISIEAILGRVSDRSSASAARCGDRPRPV
jgi:delta 1-pyrroline-5-carboxylate dehydrogenase